MFEFENKEGLKCPFSLEEMKAHYAMEQLTYQTYHCMKADISRLTEYNIDAGFLNGTDDEYACRKYVSEVYQFVKYGGPK